MKITIDAMGGDNAPEAVVKGAMKAVNNFPDLSITLVGNKQQIAKYLIEHERIAIIHTDVMITGDDEPVRAVRRKKDASMVIAAQEVAEGRSDACISAGNTGALMAAGLFVVGRIKGIERPALAPTLPTIDGNGVLLLDVGANADAKPKHLLQNAYMGAVYSKKVRGIQNPRIGLLNIGTESHKGNELTKQAYELFEKANFHFVGNVEARDLLEGVCDVAVTDGFTGNMILKTVEGTAMSIVKMLKEILMSSFKTKMAALVIKNDLAELKNKMDYSEYGGALLFGLQAPVVKAHGSSDEQAIFSAIRQARDMVNGEVPQKITEAIEDK